MTGFVSVRLWKTLITPFFWPTKIRPSDANCSTVGFVSPLSATESRNPVGSVDAAAGAGPACVMSAVPSTIAAVMISLRARVPPAKCRMSTPDCQTRWRIPGASRVVATWHLYITAAHHVYGSRPLAEDAWRDG